MPGSSHVYIASAGLAPGPQSGCPYADLHAVRTACTPLACHPERGICRTPSQSRLQWSLATTTPSSAARRARQGTATARCVGQSKSYRRAEARVEWREVEPSPEVASIPPGSFLQATDAECGIAHSWDMILQPPLPGLGGAGFMGRRLFALSPGTTAMERMQRSRANRWGSGGAASAGPALTAVCSEADRARNSFKMRAPGVQCKSGTGGSSNANSRTLSSFWGGFSNSKPSKPMGWQGLQAALQLEKAANRESVRVQSLAFKKAKGESAAERTSAAPRSRHLGTAIEERHAAFPPGAQGAATDSPSAKAISPDEGTAEATKGDHDHAGLRRKKYDEAQPLVVPAVKQQVTLSN